MVLVPRPLEAKPPDPFVGARASLVKIAHLLDEPWHSGLTAYALVLAEGQMRAGHEASIWALEGSPASREARRRHVPFFAIDRPYLRIRELRAELRRGSYRVLNAHTGRTHTLGLLVASGSGAAVVRTRSDARMPRLRPGQAWLLSRTSGVIAANRQILSGWEAAAPLPSAKAVIHQGIALDEEFQPSPLPRTPIAGLLGRLDPVKGHGMLIEAAALVKASSPLRIRVAGADANLRLADLQREAAGAGVADRIEFEGRVPNAGSFMSGCSFGLIASSGSEAVSRAALEWMASGRALVATGVGALPELVEDERTGLLVPPSDPSSFAEAMIRLSSEPLAAEMGRRARRRVEERFGLERFVQDTNQLYELALAGREARA
jgi:glycosyltransferase involved in cell wall biosynthesis